MKDNKMEYFHAVYERQADRIYRIAMIYLNNEADAEDALQSIFLKQIEKDRRFDNPEEEKAWYITVTKNYCKDILKSVWNKRNAIEDVEEPEAQSVDTELVNDMEQAMAKLPPVDREILYLYYYEGYRINEIAKILKYRESTVGSKLAAARNKLKDQFKEDQDAR